MSQDLYSRRRFAAATGTTLAGVLAGCSDSSENGEPDNNSNSLSNNSNSYGGETDDTTDENNANSEDSPDFPESGTLQIMTSDGPLGPDGVFEGDVELLLQTPTGEPISEEQVIERYHGNQLQKRAEQFHNEQKSQILQELPHNILNEQWVMENLVKEMPEIYTGKNPENPFQKEKYTSDQDFQTRYTESNFKDLWNITAHVALGGPSSVHDYIKADAIAATEYHAANKENFTFHVKTNDGTHGLAWMIENASWTPDNQQETHIIETDPNEEEQVIDLDEKHGYPNKEQKVFTETDGQEYKSGFGWRMIGKEDRTLEYDNISVEFHSPDEFEEALEDPEDHGLKPYIFSSLIAHHIEENAYPEGEHKPDSHLPEFKNAHLDIYTDRIEYQLQ